MSVGQIVKLAGVPLLVLGMQPAAMAAPDDEKKKDQDRPSKAASAEKKSELIRWSKLGEFTVVGRSGENLGRLEEMVVNPHSGKILYVSVDPSLASDAVALPIELAEVDFALRQIQFKQLSGEDIERAPRLTADRWPHTLDTSWLPPEAQKRFRERQHEREHHPTRMPENGMPEDPAPDQPMESRTHALKRAHASSNILGLDVQSATGDGIGEIDDMIVDACHGEVVGYVIGAGGILGIGETTLFVPSRALDFRTKADEPYTLEHARFNKAKTDLVDRAPRFRDENLQEQGYLERVYLFYGLQPPERIERDEPRTEPERSGAQPDRTPPDDG